MIRLQIKRSGPIRYPDDVKRIVNILYAKGYWSTPDECRELWELYSDSMCAGWLGLPDDDEELFENIKPWIED